eukprot:464735-Pleurochrysis_carterae.AAC.1
MACLNPWPTSNAAFVQIFSEIKSWTSRVLAWTSAAANGVSPTRNWKSTTPSDQKSTGHECPVRRVDCREAEVGELDVASGGDEHVLRLDVAVDDALRRDECGRVGMGR